YYAVGLTMAGLNFGLLIGVVSGLISFIPYVGSLTALVLSLAIATAQFFPDWSHIVLVAGVVLFGQFVEGNVLAPYLVGHSVGLHPVWLMFALFAFGYLFGFVGLLLAVPLAAAAGVLIRFAVRRYRESPIYTGSRPVLRHDVAFNVPHSTATRAGARAPGKLCARGFPLRTRQRGRADADRLLAGLAGEGHRAG